MHAPPTCPRRVGHEPHRGPRHWFRSGHSGTEPCTSEDQSHSGCAYEQSRRDQLADLDLGRRLQPLLRRALLAFALPILPLHLAVMADCEVGRACRHDRRSRPSRQHGL